MNTFYVELVSPNKTLFSGEIIRLKVTCLDGKREFLASHLPCLCALSEGKCEITLPDNTRKSFITEDGVLNVGKDKAVLTSEYLEWAENYEKAKALREKQIEEEIIRRGESYKEYKLGTVALRRAFINLKNSKYSKF